MPKKTAEPKAKPTKDPQGGLTAAGRAHFKETEGANLKPGVKGAADTPEKQRRKGSFLRRHFANPEAGPLQDEKGQPTRHALSAQAWGEPVPKTPADVKNLAEKGSELLEQYKESKEGTGAAKPKTAKKAAPAADEKKAAPAAKAKAPKAQEAPAKPKAAPAKNAKAKAASEEDTYTDPALRHKIKERLQAGDKGGKPGQWSARKAQMLAAEYEKEGGGYKQAGRTETQHHLESWTEEKWQTADGDKAQHGETTARYLPKEAWDKLTPAERKATDEKKKKASRTGQQFVANTEKAKTARKSATHHKE